MSVLMPIDGVLRGGVAPIREGLFLYNALVEADTRVVLTTTGSRADAEYWLMQTGIKGYAAILDNTYDLGDATPLWERHISASRAAGRVDIVVATHPDVVAYCLNAGIVSVLFEHPKHAIPAARPNREIRSWADIVAQTESKEIKEWTE